MNNTIRELKAHQDERDAMIEALSRIMDRQRDYMDMKMDENTGELIKDSNGDFVYDLPAVDSTDWNYFQGYQRVIDAIIKLLK